MRTEASKVELQKKEILKTAITVFSEKGYAGTKLTDISDRMGITRTPLYYHFGTKDQLFKEAYDISASALTDALANIFRSKSCFFDKIKNEFVYFSSRIGKEMSRLNEEIRMNKDILAESYERHTQLRHDLFRIKANAVKAAIEAGELRKDADADIVASTIFVFYYGLTSNATQFIDEEIRYKTIDNFISMFRLKFEDKNKCTEKSALKKIV